MRLGQTPSQTVGPYFSMRLGGEGQNVVAAPDAERIVIGGRVLDGDGNHVEDALVEAWQADPAGHYRHPDDHRGTAAGFVGFARAMSDFETGEYRIETVKPGRVPDPEGGLQAPHISLIVQARGMLNPVYTRIYFADEAEANAEDLILGRVPTDRKATLVARLVEGTEPKEYRFDIVLQGDDETVFFDV